MSAPKYWPLNGYSVDSIPASGLACRQGDWVIYLREQEDELKTNDPNIQKCFGVLGKIEGGIGDMHGTGFELTEDGLWLCYPKLYYGEKDQHRTCALGDVKYLGRHDMSEDEAKNLVSKWNIRDLICRGTSYTNLVEDLHEVWENNEDFKFRDRIIGDTAFQGTQHENPQIRLLHLDCVAQRLRYYRSVAESDTRNFHYENFRRLNEQVNVMSMRRVSEEKQQCL